MSIQKRLEDKIGVDFDRLWLGSYVAGYEFWKNMELRKQPVKLSPSSKYTFNQEIKHK